MEKYNQALLSREQAADRLGITSRTLYNLTRPRGKLPCVKLAGRILYDPADIAAFIERSKVRGGQA